MDVRLRDGTIIKNVPEGITQEDLMARVEQMRAPEPRIPEAPTATETPKASGDVLGMEAEPLLHYASGFVAKPVSDVMGLAAMVKDWASGERGDVTGFKKHIQESLTYTPRSKVGKAIVESPYNPLNVIGRAVGSVAETAAEPFRDEAGSQADVRNMIANAIQEGVPHGIGIGMVKAAPSVARGAQRVTEAVAAPLEKIGAAARGVLGPIEGRAGRFLEHIAGPKREAVIKALETSKPSLPGERLDVGLAAAPAASPEFSALAEMVAERAPGIYKSGGIGAANEAARMSAMTKHALDPTKITKMIAERDAATRPIRVAALKAADEAGVKVAPLLDKLDEIIKNPETPTLTRKTMNSTRNDIVRRAGGEDTVPAGGLYTVRKEIGEKIKQHAGAENWSKARSAGIEVEVQRVIDDAMSAAAGPKWNAYLAKYSEMSRPIENAKTAESLRSMLRDPLDVKERPGMFAKKTGEAEIKSAQLNLTADKVLESLQRVAEHTRLAREGAPAAARLMGAEIPQVPAAGMFSPHFSVSRAILNRLADRATNQLLTFLEQNMDKPAKIAELMRKATPAQVEIIKSTLSPAAMQALGFTIPVAEEQQRNTGETQ